MININNQFYFIIWNSQPNVIIEKGYSFFKSIGLDEDCCSQLQSSCLFYLEGHHIPHDCLLSPLNRALSLLPLLPGNLVVQPVSFGSEKIIMLVKEENKGIP